MKDFRILFGYVPGITFGMWLRGVWFWLALCMCNPADDAPFLVFELLLANVVASALCVIVFDRRRWKEIGDKVEER